MLITLEQAIQLANKAHEDQWRKPTIINYSQLEKLIGGSSACDLQAECFVNNVYKYNNKLITKLNDDEYYYYKPYITHSLEVMNMLSTKEEQIVAVLHDVFEKCPNWCLGRIMDDSEFYIKDRSENIEYITTANVYWALMLISKDKHVKYNDYIYNMIHDIKLDGTPNKLAVKVKLADILSNLSDNPSNYAKQKYAKALPILLQGI